MRNPLRKAACWLTLAVAGIGGFVAAMTESDRLNEATEVVLGAGGVIAAIAGFAFLVFSALAAIGHARLLSGIGVVTRWRLTPQEWDRFRALDAIRTGQDVRLTNDLWIRKRTPARGVDVIVGRRQLIVDGSYHALRPRGLPELRAVCWLGAPADPECLEFALYYSDRRSGRFVTLRVPVAATARSEGIRVFEHYQAIIPAPKSGIASRRPKLVLGCALAIACVSAAVGTAGWLMNAAGDGSLFVAGLAIGGTLTAIAAVIFAMVVGIAVRLDRA